MASKKTEVIYRRPKGSYDDHDPDMWEDDAIIKAYDEAVSDVAMPASSTLEDALTPSKKLRTENPEMGEPIWQRSSGLEGTGLTIESSGTGTELKDSGVKSFFKLCSNEIITKTKKLIVAVIPY